ncbi:hypothetical protein THAOC_16257 [Thalassiosira oceanica]|uniref:Leucine-rich repeat domain-containing protein n=1 Tax=Thalassiosira oceanica TaxID=159749 RepID=K0SQ32_THAOC|nr:hypothetical protein THAOC_16257 [Thalassiosira oceanica]|eukprot:EJK63106.1 hypothetical protein THAOC_16257 [Thalassiosira oceanica]
MLGSNAFQGCLNLTEVHFNDGMQIIGPGAFCDCKALRSVAVPATVSDIGNSAFKNCTELAKRNCCVTAESLHQVLRLISYRELKESSILIELAVWKSKLVADRARADCRISIPDPAKRLIMEYCGFTGFLEPAIESNGA